MALIYIDGVMFNEEQTILIHLPVSFKGFYKVPSTIKKIGIQAFYGCSKLMNVELPQGLQTINMLAFEGCRHLHSICIPESVTSIGYRAFANCSELQTIQVEHETPLTCSTNCDIFKNTDISKCTLIVPIGSRMAYLKAPVWRDFGKIVEIGQGNLKKFCDKEKQKVAVVGR